MAGPDSMPPTSQVDLEPSPTPTTDLDFRALAYSQRRNAEAIVQISQLALDGLQRAWRRQLDFVRQAIDELSSFVVDLGDTGSFDRQLARQAEFSKQSFDRILFNAREFTEITTRATNEAMSLVNQRLTEGLDDLRRAQERRVP